jgi:ADP-ribose pyrophosphatase YjhB (NUDIX family)
LLTRVLYSFLGKLAGLTFNILNVCLAGNLPPLGSVGVIVEDQGRYLLIKRPGGLLVFPGGFIRWRERPTQTAEREFREETGLQVTLQHLVACYSHTGQNALSMSTLTLVFCGELRGGHMRASVEGQPCWVEESSLLEMIDVRYRRMLHDYRELRDKGMLSGIMVRGSSEKYL